jgi:hypothetical protein
MPQSARYRTLQRRIAELEANLLPPTKATGDYTAAEYDRTRAFRVLAHAEIEACLEDIAFAVADTSNKKWQIDRRARKSLLALMAYYEGKRELPSLLIPGKRTPQELRHLIENARNEYCNRLRQDNNGIREANILAILLPVGITLAQINSTWLATTDSFGQDRGATAHQSAVRSTSLPDPKAESSTVGQVVSGLAGIDELLLVLAR